MKNFKITLAFFIALTLIFPAGFLQAGDSVGPTTMTDQDQTVPVKPVTVTTEPADNAQPVHKSATSDSPLEFVQFPAPTIVPPTVSGANPSVITNPVQPPSQIVPPTSPSTNPSVITNTGQPSPSPDTNPEPDSPIYTRLDQMLRSGITATLLVAVREVGYQTLTTTTGHRITAVQGAIERRGLLIRVTFSYIDNTSTVVPGFLIFDIDRSGVFTDVTPGGSTPVFSFTRSGGSTGTVRAIGVGLARVGTVLIPQFGPA